MAARSSGWLGPAIVFALLASAAAGPAPAAAGQGQGPFTPEQKSQFLQWYEAQPQVDVPVDAEGARVVVVKFNDYQCPPCRQTYYDYKPILDKYAAGGQVKFILKHFPLEAECNAAAPRGSHVAACEAAAAVVMAQSKGTADKLEQWLFANQQALTGETVRQAAKDVAGISDFDTQYARALTLVKTDAGLGGLLGAKSTPTFFINGRRIAGGLPPEAFALAIEHELKRPR